MRIRVSGIFLFVCITTCLSLAIDRPQTPTIDDVDFDGQTITIWGSKDDGDSCHAVLITDLTVPFQYGNDISRSELGSDGAAINWAQENFPMNIKIGNKSIERYYIAVAVSDIIDGKRVFSPWRLYCDSLLGLPVSISTSHDSISETFFRRGRFIDENNGSKLVLDLTFSLATSKASSCKLKLKKNSSVILDIDNLASISGSKTDINDAIQNTSGIDNSLIFKRESNGFYLYNIYQMVDYNSSDTFSATLIM